jgi:hypothetical protein
MYDSPAHRNRGNRSGETEEVQSWTNKHNNICGRIMGTGPDARLPFFNAEMMYLGPIELICTSQFRIAIKMEILPSKFWPDVRCGPKISGNSGIDAF